MLKSDVHSHFGTLEAVGKAVGISKQGVWMWPRIVPEGHAYKLQVITHGALQVDPLLYVKRVRLRRRKPMTAHRKPK